MISYLQKYYYLILNLTPVNKLVLHSIMQVHKDISNLPFFKNAVITIGTFDGVHTGHLQIIEQLKEEARMISGETVIITFDPHPRLVVPAADHNIRLLNTLEEKIELLANKQIDHLVVVPFTELFSQQTAEEYIDKFIFQFFHPHTIIIGFDHHFGKDRRGNYLLLEEFSRQYHFQVKQIPEHVLNEITISSTKIRNALLGNDIATANKFLGYDYFFEGVVVEGDKIGRTIGYPTANLVLGDQSKLVPGDGIYAVEIAIEDASIRFNGMMSIGLRPTIGKSNRTIEIHVLDFKSDLYDKIIRVFVKSFIRSELKFKDLEELKRAIANDEIIARRLLTKIN